jgi:hypothetical protein
MLTVAGLRCLLAVLDARPVLLRSCQQAPRPAAYLRWLQLPSRDRSVKGGPNVWMATWKHHKSRL